jgi:hypothetical protein
MEEAFLSGLFLSRFFLYGSLSQSTNLEFCVDLFFMTFQPVKSVLAVGSATTTCIPVGSACTNEYVEAAAPVIF